MDTPPEHIPDGVPNRELPWPNRQGEFPYPLSFAPIGSVEVLSIAAPERLEPICAAKNRSGSAREGLVQEDFESDRTKDGGRKDRSVIEIVEARQHLEECP